MEKVHDPLAAIVAADKLATLLPAAAVMVPPPHVPVCPFGAVITRPAGKVSLKVTPLKLCVVFGLLIVKLNEVEPFSGMLAAPKDLTIAAGATTVILALDVLPVPPSVDVTGTLLFFTPDVVPVTFTETVQLVLNASVPAARLMELPTAVAVPPQVLFKFGVAATTSPVGRLSVKAIPVSATLVFGLVTLNVSVVVPFNGIVAAPKALAMAGGLATVRLAVAVFPAPPLVEVTLPVVLV